jgi:hypothetical protein
MQIVLSSWQPKGRHPRLTAVILPKDVDAGPAPGMTKQQRPRQISRNFNAHATCAGHDAGVTGTAVLTPI